MKKGYISSQERTSSRLTCQYSALSEIFLFCQAHHRKRIMKRKILVSRI